MFQHGERRIAVSHTYVAFYYHFIWATKRREPVITAGVEPALNVHIRERCKEMGVFVYALDGVEDHRHLVCSVPPRLAVGEFMQKLKGGSSHYINHMPDGRFRLQWQVGYGGHTFSLRDLKRVVAYVENQKQHHR
jgi:putative transposase